MRSPQALALAAFMAALAAATLWWFDRAPESPPEFEAKAPPSAAAASDLEDAVSTDGGRTPAESEPGGLSRLGSRSPFVLPTGSKALPLIDVYFFWSDGEPLGNLELATDSTGSAAVWPCWLAPGAVSAARSVPLVRGYTQWSTDPGWFTAIPQPPDRGDSAPMEIGLALGDEILAREPVVPGAAAVRVTLDRARVEGALCAVRGRLPGLDDAASYVAAWPLARGLGLLGAQPATGVGDEFLVSGLPPGPVTLVLAGSPAQLRAGLFELARDRNISALSQGRRVPDREQWDLRLDFLRTRSEPLGRWQLELEPGEDRDLGALEFERAGAVVLRLVDGIGAPIEATGVQIARLGSGAGGGLPAAAPTVWTYDSWAAVLPLPPDRTELFVTQGERAALLTVTPDEALEARPVTLEVLSVLQVPLGEGDGEDVRVTTGDGHALVSDPRWLGSTYRGVAVGAGTWLLPPGVYQIEGLGAPRPIALPAAHRIDLREDTRYDGPLEAPGEGH